MAKVTRPHGSSFPEPRDRAGSPNAGLSQVALLGLIEIVSVDGRVIRLDAGRQTALMVVLSLRAGTAFSAGELVDAVWEPPAPERATQLLHSFLSRLRRALQPESVRWQRHGLLNTANGGYTLRCHGSRWTSPASRTWSQKPRRHVRGDVQAVDALFDTALGYWRGQPFAGVPGPMLERERSRLTSGGCGHGRRSGSGS
jgi:Transcriptional regulatory protein, C terminal